MDRKLPWRLALVWAAACHAAAAELPDSAVLADQLRQAAGPALAGARRVEVSVGSLDPRLRLAPCAKIEPVIPPAARLWGKVRIALRCTEGARWQVYLPVTVKVFGAGVVAQRALPAGTVLAAADLGTAEVDLAADPQGAIGRPELAVGRALARPLVTGQPVGHADLRARQWFAAGDTVQIVAAGPGFRIGGVGQALSAGVEGQTARVRVEGGRTLTGRPFADRKIEVPM